MIHEWHAVAKQLKSEGWNAVAIAKHLDKPPSTVRGIINGRAHYEAQRTKRRREAREKERLDFPVLAVQDAGVPTIWQYRQIKRTLVPPEQITEAAQLFAKGEIDRKELMRRITIIVYP
jgi:hypothetical protein